MAVAKKEKKQVSRIRDYKQAFGTQAGIRVLQDLMQSHWMLRTSFVRNDPQLSAFQEGERNVVIRILSILKINPEQLQQHIEEIENNVRT